MHCQLAGCRHTASTREPARSPARSVPAGRGWLAKGAITGERAKRRYPLPPAPAPIGKPDTTLAASPVAEGPHLIVEPQVGDGRLWVLARPALPADVADVLYGPHDRKDSVAVQRLRAMVDSLNQIISVEQRVRRKPTWTTDVAGKTLGIDSQYIHIAGKR